MSIAMKMFVFSKHEVEGYINRRKGVGTICLPVELVTDAYIGLCHMPFLVHKRNTSRSGSVPRNHKRTFYSSIVKGKRQSIANQCATIFVLALSIEVRDIHYNRDAIKSSPNSVRCSYPLPHPRSKTAHTNCQEVHHVRQSNL